MRRAVVAAGCLVAGLGSAAPAAARPDAGAIRTDATYFNNAAHAVASSPLGPFRKFPGNPILQQNPAIGEYPTGHGSIVASPDGAQLYYPHRGRSALRRPTRSDAFTSMRCTSRSASATRGAIRLCRSTRRRATGRTCAGAC